MDEVGEIDSPSETGPRVFMNSAPRGSGSEAIAGRAHTVRHRFEPHGRENVLSFRLEIYDRSGERLATAPVELRATSVEGSIEQGDWVIARGEWKNGTLRAKQADNVTTGAGVRAQRHGPLAYIVAFLVLTFIAVVFGVITYTVFFAPDRDKTQRLPRCESSFAKEICDELRERGAFEKTSPVRG